MKLRIEQDADATSPSEWGDEALFLVANHRDCYIPEPEEKRITNNASELVERYRGTHWIFPLEAYIHSGVRLALSGEGNFPDRQWDVSREEWPVDAAKARQAALCKVEEWNQYLSGEVYGCIIEDDNGKTVDSCWGFYGYKHAQEEGARMLADAEEQAKREAVEAHSMACRDLATV